MRRVIRRSIQHDQARWPGYKDDLTRVFKAKTQAQWCAILEDTDVCFAPALSVFEAPPIHTTSSATRLSRSMGVTQPALAPRFSRTSPEVRSGARRPGEDSQSVLLDYGFSRSDIETLRSKGVIPAV